MMQSVVIRLLSVVSVVLGLLSVVSVVLGLLSVAELDELWKIIEFKSSFDIPLSS